MPAAAERGRAAARLTTRAIHFGDNLGALR
jgi:hypothetical protein